MNIWDDVYYHPLRFVFQQHFNASTAIMWHVNITQIKQYHWPLYSRSKPIMDCIIFLSLQRNWGTSKLIWITNFIGEFWHMLERSWMLYCMHLCHYRVLVYVLVILILIIVIVNRLITSHNHDTYLHSCFQPTNYS